MRLYLIRHAQSMGNLTGDYSTKTHDQLSETGWIQAHALAERLKKLKIDHLYVSPLTRALQTIYPYCKAKRTQAQIWPELAESCWQDDITIRPENQLRLEAMPWDSGLNRKYYTFRDGRELRPAWDEDYSLGVYRNRITQELLKTLHGGTDHTVVAVTHGFTMAHLISGFLGLERMNWFDHANTAATCLVQDGESFRLEFQDSLELQQG